MKKTIIVDEPKYYKVGRPAPGEIGQQRPDAEQISAVEGDIRGPSRG